MKDVMSDALTCWKGVQVAHLPNQRLSRWFHMPGTEI